MKKLLTILMVLAIIAGSLALADNEVFEYYQTVVDKYTAATAEGVDEDAATELLRELIAYYTKNEERKLSLDKYLNAKLYFCYAQGRIAVSEGRFKEASTYFRECRDFGYKTDVYMSFSAGMMYMDAGRYRYALDMFNELSSEPVISAQLSEAIGKCERLYKNELMTKAAVACTKEDHQTAQGYYKELLEVLPFDLDILDAFDECVRHSSEEGKAETQLRFTGVISTAPDSLDVRWNGNGSSYKISWSMDLTGKTGISSAETNQTNYTITGLMPGTSYYIKVECNGVSVIDEKATLAAGPYSKLNPDFKWSNSSVIYRFDSRAAFLASGKKSGTYLRVSNLKSLSDRTIQLFNPSILGGAIEFVFTLMDDAPADIQDVPYTMLMHVSGNGTLMREGTVGDEFVYTERDTMFVLTYDIFDELLDIYTDLTDAEFTLEILIKDSLAVSANGKLK